MSGNSNLTINTATFSNNYALANGGAIYANSYYSINF